MFFQATKRVKIPLIRNIFFEFSKFDKKPDLYSLLDVKPTATEKEIQYNYDKRPQRL